MFGCASDFVLEGIIIRKIFTLNFVEFQVWYDIVGI